MAKKVSKFFRIGVEGDTCDGRIISASDIQEMADTFDPRVYGCRINLEHIKGLLPDSRRFSATTATTRSRMVDPRKCLTVWAKSPRHPDVINSFIDTGRTIRNSSPYRISAHCRRTNLRFS